MEKAYVYLLLAAACLLQLTPTAVSKSEYTLECEMPMYSVNMGESVHVCFRLVGPLPTETEGGVTVYAAVTTQPTTAGDTEFIGGNTTYNLSYVSDEGGMSSLPCVGVLARPAAVREGVEGVRVIIEQSEPLQVVSNCTVHISNETTTRGTTPTQGTVPSPNGGNPQPQAASLGGAIAGAVIGALVGVTGIVVAIVTILVVYFVYCRRRGDTEHKRLDSSSSQPRPVVYKKNGDAELNGSIASVESQQTTPTKVQTTPTKVPITAPAPIPVYENQRGSQHEEDDTPISPIYSYVEHGMGTEPEMYEVPISLTNQTTDETALEYEVPLASRSNSDETASGCGQDDHHLYHTLEPPVV